MCVAPVATVAGSVRIDRRFLRSLTEPLCVAVRFLVRLKTEPPDQSFLQCGGAGVVEERPCDEAQRKRDSEVGVGGAAALDELLEHSARILPDFVQHRRLLDTGDAAERRAFFDDGVLPFDVLVRVVSERDARMAALLRAPVNEPILADVEEARTGVAVPCIG